MKTNKQTKKYWLVVCVSFVFVTLAFLGVFSALSNEKNAEAESSNWMFVQNWWSAGLPTGEINNNIFVINAATSSDAMFVRNFEVEPNTYFTFTAEVHSTGTSAHLWWEREDGWLWTRASHNSSISGWQTLELKFNSQNYSQVRLALRHGFSGDDSHGITQFRNVRLIQHETTYDNNWHILGVVIRNIDVNISGIGRVQLQMSERDERVAAEMFNRAFSALPIMADGRMTITREVHFIDVPLTSVSPLWGGYWASPNDIYPLISDLLATQRFDHVSSIIRLNRTGSPNIPTVGWSGLASFREDIGFCLTQLGPAYNWWHPFYENVNSGTRSPVVHEFIHTLERNSRDRGILSESDSNVIDHMHQFIAIDGLPYDYIRQNNPNFIDGQLRYQGRYSQFYTDFMRGTVRRASQPTRFFGLSPQSFMVRRFTDQVIYGSIGGSTGSDVPTNLSVNNNILSWQGGDNNFGFRVYLNGVSIGETSVNVWIFNLSNISFNGSHYFLQVRRLGNGTTVPSSNLSVQYDIVRSLLSVVSNLRIGDYTATTLSPQIMWDAVLNATHYQIYLGGEYFATVTGIQANLLNISSNIPIGTHSVQLRAVSNSIFFADSVLSESIEVFLRRRLDPFTWELDFETFEMTWEPVENADSFAIFVVSTREGETYVWDWNIGNVLRFDLNTVRGEIGLGSFSVAVQALTSLPYHINIGSAFRGFTFEQLTLLTPQNISIDENALILTWDEVTGATGYYVYVDGERISSKIFETTVSLTLLGLTGGNDYDIQIRAVSTATYQNDSDLSEKINFITSTCDNPNCNYFNCMTCIRCSICNAWNCEETHVLCPNPYCDDYDCNNCERCEICDSWNCQATHEICESPDCGNYDCMTCIRCSICNAWNCVECKSCENLNCENWNCSECFECKNPNCNAWNCYDCELCENSNCENWNCDECIKCDECKEFLCECGEDAPIVGVERGCKATSFSVYSNVGTIVLLLTVLLLLFVALKKRRTN